MGNVQGNYNIAGLTNASERLLKKNDSTRLAQEYPSIYMAAAKQGLVSNSGNDYNTAQKLAAKNKTSQSQGASGGSAGSMNYDA